MSQTPTQGCTVTICPRRGHYKDDGEVYCISHAPQEAVNWPWPNTSPTTAPSGWRS